MPEGENEQEHRWQGDDGKSFRMAWQLYRPGYGNTVELTTGAALWHMAQLLEDGIGV